MEIASGPVNWRREGEAFVLRLAYWDSVLIRLDPVSFYKLRPAPVGWLPLAPFSLMPLLLVLIQIHTENITPFAVGNPPNVKLWWKGAIPLSRDNVLH